MSRDVELLLADMADCCKDVESLRNILAHAYWQVDTHVLWDSATRSVPELHRELARLH